MSLEVNKIFAAILIAGITAKLAGFAADHVIHAKDLTENAYQVEVPDRIPMATAGTAPTGPDPIAGLLAGADPARGQKLSKACAACHTFTQGGAHRVGPNLWNIVDRKKASASGFAYSSALKEKGGTWTAEALNEFLYKPKTYVPGTKMVYVGMKKAEDRAAMVKWLQSLK